MTGKRLIALLLAVFLLVALSAGCSGPQSGAETEAPAPSSAAPEDQTPAPAAPEGLEPESTPAASEEPLYTTGESSIPFVVTSTKHLSYPLAEETVTLTGAAMMDANFYAYMPDDYFASGYAYQKAMEATGVKFECETYSMETASTQLGLLIAAESTPDIVIGLNGLYSTGVEGLLDDEVVYDLRGYIQEFCPDFYAYWESNSTYQALALSESGKLPAVYSAVNTLGYENSVSPFGAQGIITRGDWLEKTGFGGDKAPKTYDEFEAYALAAATEFGPEIPLFITPVEAIFLYGYDLCGSFSVESDGAVTYDLVSDNYKEYIKMMARWYSEGLLDADFMLNGLKMGYGDAISAGMTLCICRDAGSHMTPGMYATGREKDPDFELQGLPYPGLTDNWKNKYGGYWADSVANGWFITTTCTEDRIPYALGFINYFWTEQGIIDANYGEEGVTWNFNDKGEREFTELISNPEKIPPFIVISAYNGMQLTGVAVNKPNFFDLEAQQEANNLWMSNLGDERVYKGMLTSDEQQAVGTSLTDIKTLQDERLYQFIFGELDIDENWDKYVDDTNNLGLAKVLEAYQAAQDRFEEKFGK